MLFHLVSRESFHSYQLIALSFVLQPSDGFSSHLRCKLPYTSWGSAWPAPPTSHGSSLPSSSYSLCTSNMLFLWPLPELSLVFSSSWNLLAQASFHHEGLSVDVSGLSLPTALVQSLLHLTTVLCIFVTEMPTCWNRFCEIQCSPDTRCPCQCGPQKLRASPSKTTFPSDTSSVPVTVLTNFGDFYSLFRVNNSLRWLT